MWVEEIFLENVKCFENDSIRFGSAKSAYPWVTLLGENGTGKSTLLQALALLLAGPEGAKQLLTRPSGWSRDESKPGKISVRIHQGSKDPGTYGGKIKERKVFQYTFYITGSETIRINNKVYTEPVITEDSNSKVLPWLRENALLPKGKGWFAAGYGAFRRLTRENKIIVPALQTPLRYTNFYTQFREDQALEAFELWMIYLDYRISKSDDSQARRQKEWGIRAINKLLPDGNSFHSIDGKGSIWFNVGGSKVSTISLSDGYRSILALAGDLVWRLIEAFPDSENPLDEEGVVLIDELDIHLHPTWQRSIAGLLREIFPNLQFIMATHSPLVAAGAGEDAVTYRFYKRDGNIRVEQIKNVYSMSVDQILKSDAFGLVSSFSPDAQSRIDRYYSLKRKSDRTRKEEEELQLHIPFIQSSLGRENLESSTERELSDFIRKNWR